MSEPVAIDDEADARISREYRDLQYWDRGFAVAKRWYHEEWDGSDIQLDLARDIALAIRAEVSMALSDYL